MLATHSLVNAARRNRIEQGCERTHGCGCFYIKLCTCYKVVPYALLKAAELGNKFLFCFLYYSPSVPLFFIKLVTWVVIMSMQGNIQFCFTLTLCFNALQTVHCTRLPASRPGKNFRAKNTSMWIVQGSKTMTMPFLLNSYLAFQKFLRNQTYVWL